MAKETQEIRKCVGGSRPGAGAPPGNLNALKHGITALDRRLKADRLDRRSFVYKWVKSRVAEYVSALGGDPSPQEKAIIWDTAMMDFYISQVDAYFSRVRIIRKGRSHPILTERTRLAAHRRENLKTLGLKRIEIKVDLATRLMLEQRAREASKTKGDAHKS